MNAHDMEGQKVWRLSDRQLLDVLAARCSELDKARLLEFCCRMFDKAAENSPTLAPGLHVAKGLVQLYGKNLASGSDQNPFKNVDLYANVASIIAKGEAQATGCADRKIGKAPKLVIGFQPDTAEDALKDFLEGVASEKHPADVDRALTVDKRCKRVGGSVLGPVAHGTMAGRWPLSQNIPRRYSRDAAPGKCSVIADKIVEVFQDRNFNMRDVVEATSAGYSNVGNAIAKLKRHKKIEKVSYGTYRVVKAAAA